MGLDDRERSLRAKMASYTAPKELLEAGGTARGEGDEDGGGDGFRKPSRVIDREDDYRKRRLARALSPARNDAFAAVSFREGEGEIGGNV